MTGPHPSTGFSDALENAITDIAKVDAPKKAVVDAYARANVTDYAMLMESETRRDFMAAEIGQSITLSEGEVAIIGMPRVTIGFPEITIESDDPAILDVGIDSVLTPDHRLHSLMGGAFRYVDRVYTRTGVQTRQPFQKRAGRYLHVACRKGSVTISRVGFHHLRYPVAQAAAFECSDDMLNRIYETSVYTAHLSMQYAWQDCLRREEGTVNTSSFNYASLGAICAFGDQAITRKTMLDIINTQDPSGWFDSHCLSAYNQDEVTQCIYYTIWARDWFIASDDRELAALLFDKLELTMRYFAKMVNRHGLLDGRLTHLSRTGEIMYVNDEVNAEPNYIGQFKGELLGSNVLFTGALTAMSDLARALGHDDRANYYHRYADRVRTGINERLWDPKRRLYANWRKGDELADRHHPILQIAAAYFGCCPQDRTERVLDFLCKEMGLPSRDHETYPIWMFGYYRYWMEILFRNGRAADAHRILRNYYGAWLDMGATTMGEGFALTRHTPEALTDEYEVHAYGTSALVHFYRNVLGVTPIEPGYRKIRIAPHPGTLLWARGEMYTPRGKIRVEWKRAGEALDMQIRIPKGVKYHIKLPDSECRGIIDINGERVPA